MISIIVYSTQSRERQCMYGKSMKDPGWTQDKNVISLCRVLNRLD